jgi:restriction endonuclease Mrr
VKQELNEINTEIISQEKRKNIQKHVEKFRTNLLNNNVNIILSDSLKEVENILIAMFAKNGYWQQKLMYSMPERITAG